MDSKIAAAVGLAAVLAAVLAPISTLTPAFAADVTAEITPGSSSKTDDAFSPNPLNVNVGDTVTWTNKDSTAHTVTSGTGANDANKGAEFDSSPNFNPIMPPGGTFKHTFETAGEFPYFCGLHPNMAGKVVVAAGGGDGDGEPTPFTVTATIDDQSFEVKGESSTAKATAVAIKPETKSIDVTFEGSGEVELTLPTDMISGISSVKAGSQTIEFTQEEGDEGTDVTFTVPDGATTVTVTGETVVPEFPVIAAILVASIAGIIGFTRFARNGTGFFGRA